MVNTTKVGLVNFRKDESSHCLSFIFFDATFSVFMQEML
jgi:hypothetical protein